MTVGPLAGRTALVTGASSGIGRAVAAGLAGRGARVLMACRDAQRAESARQEIIQRSGNPAVEVLLADLSVQGQVRRLAAQVRGPLHVLVNNAGVLEERRRLSADGVELTWATNVLGYFLLTDLLLEHLRAGAGARVVNVASEYAGGLDLEDVQFAGRPYGGSAAYRQSKQADRMLTWALARRLEGAGITANALHPGVVNTALLARASGRPWPPAGPGARAPGRTAEQGADTVVWLAASEDVRGVSGRYWIDRRETACRFRDVQQEERLWALCASMVSA